MRKRKIVLAGDFVREYEIGFWSYVGIQIIRLYLCVLRWFRRLKRGIGYCKYALAVIPLWVIYVAVVYAWGSFRMQDYSVGQILWDMKTGFFTSVVLAGATSFITQRNKNKYAFLAQHNEYINIMDKCSQLYKDLSVLLCGDNSKKDVPFWPFYTDEMCRTTYKKFAKWNNFDKNSVAYKYVLQSISELKRDLERLGQNIYIGHLSECNSYKLSGLIVECNDKIAWLERTLESGDFPLYKDTYMWNLSAALYKLIDCLRDPWRRDLKWKLKVLKMIYKQDTNVASTFYNSAFLDVVDYDRYEHADELIEKLRKEYAKQKETSEEDCCV